MTQRAPGPAHSSMAGSAEAETFRAVGLQQEKEGGHVDPAVPRSSPGHEGAIGPPESKGATAMRVMVIVKATKNSEAGVMPSEQLLAEMGKFNEELVKAGIMLAGDGPAPQPQGQARALRRRQEDRHRRPLRRDQGADRRLLDLAGEVDGGGGRVGAGAARTRCRARSRRSRSGRCSRPRTSAQELTPELRAQEDRLRAEARAAAEALGRANAGARDVRGSAQGHRGGLADRVRPAHRRSCAHGQGRRPGRGPRAGRAASRPWSAGPRRASPRTRAPG